ncbi:nuclear transport factor 2 family protein [Nocardia sp. NPDC052278]|uniref:nuclear transport factor 2 family protein n=1 Tax=unclassified Nocardia TaxID=2637762 RepID=UPI0036C009F6
MTDIWTVRELEDAFALHADTVAAAAESGDWEPFVQLFLPEAIYIDPMQGIMRGHAEIRPWVTATLGTFPGSAMRYPEAWHLLDLKDGRIVCELRNVLRDPGDGGSYEENNISILDYAGDGRFRCERDIYDSPTMIRLIESWGRRCFELGSLTSDEQSWFAAAYPHILEQQSNAAPGM